MFNRRFSRRNSNEGSRPNVENALQTQKAENVLQSQRSSRLSLNLKLGRSSLSNSERDTRWSHHSDSEYTENNPRYFESGGSLPRGFSLARNFSPEGNLKEKFDTRSQRKDMKSPSRDHSAYFAALKSPKANAYDKSRNFRYDSTPELGVSMDGHQFTRPHRLSQESVDRQNESALRRHNSGYIAAFKVNTKSTFSAIISILISCQYAEGPNLYVIP